ncbi:succinate--CoA ligase subunit beta [Bacillus sp. FJAT-29790]|uniref:succinate--CoA ligase subunit beta n=1 Tax=Bacillus sp. FJAT-29790 TaxID=1895002 RepID=UPI001C240506|nr:succinate--CoA ligase subunit beta [Bacillus sp. FJAT-29790]MBU8878114.1 succinate--CoA ligase subunit beta [Bacillus sp. FJAT-29790]
MKLFEYQAKDIFEESSIPVPNRILIKNNDEAENAVNEVGIPCVLKAQVLHGGRGKAGLIKLVSELDAVQENADGIFSRAKNMPYLLIEEAINIEKELYVSISADPMTGYGMIMACAEGGIDIEEIARTMPEQIKKLLVDPSVGLLPYQARSLLYELGIQQEMIGQGTKILLNLYDIFQKYELELVEINPLMITKEGGFIAGDGKVSIDDNALFRHPQFSMTREYFENDAQYEAAQEGIPYLQFDGNIGLMCAGAGLTNTVFDLVNDYGGSVANYLEFGGPNYHKARKAMEIMMKNDIKVMLIVTFGTIARADVMAKGVVDAIKELKPDFPIVTAIRGTGEEEAHELLRGAGLDPLKDTEEAVITAIALAGGGKR